MDGPHQNYIKTKESPEDKNEAKMIKNMFVIYNIDRVLYTRRFGLPNLRCLTLEEVDYVLRENPYMDL